MWIFLHSTTQYISKDSPNPMFIYLIGGVDHMQETHDTSHGSMQNTAWVIDGDELDAYREVSGRRFASGDEGAAVLCNQVCSDLGRHTHVDLCRTKRGSKCSEPETEHIMDVRGPKTSTGKDWITHKLHWSRSGMFEIHCCRCFQNHLICLG